MDASGGLFFEPFPGARSPAISRRWFGFGRRVIKGGDWGPTLTRDDLEPRQVSRRARGSRNRGLLSLAPKPCSGPIAFLGFVQNTHTSRPVQGIAECERALALDRHFGRRSWASLVLPKYFSRFRGEETEGHIHGGVVSRYLLVADKTTLTRWLNVCRFSPS